VNGEIDAVDMEDAVFSHISVSQDTAEEIQMNTVQQSQSTTWYKECQWRITVSYLGQLCKMHKSTSPVRLATTIANQSQKQFVSVGGKDNEPNAVLCYVQVR